MINKPTPALIVLSFDQWESRFRPIQNTITENAAYGGTLFETYGADLAEVLLWANSDRSRKVWTLVEGNETPAIAEGYRLCNRLGYFLTEKPARKGRQYEIPDA